MRSKPRMCALRLTVLCLLATGAVAQSKPVVVLIATGGTIAMEIDPVKHAPAPAISGER
jgi:L-asparaginase